LRQSRPASLPALRLPKMQNAACEGRIFV
jgi:hypothetical protein